MHCKGTFFTDQELHCKGPILKAEFWAAKFSFQNRTQNLILFATGTGTGMGKKYKFIKLKEKSLSFFPQEKVELSSTFSCGHAGKRLGKRV